MDIFPHIFVTENKRKRGRGRPIFLKKNMSINQPMKYGGSIDWGDATRHFDNVVMGAVWPDLAIFLDFGQLFIAFGNNLFAQIYQHP